MFITQGVSCAILAQVKIPAIAPIGVRLCRGFTGEFPAIAPVEVAFVMH